MPFQNIETSTLTYPSFSTTKNVDYNLGALASTNPAYGVSVQANYVFLTATTLDIKLQASNDGVAFADIPTTTVTVTATGMTIWDCGNPNYKILRVVFSGMDGTLTASLVLNAVNLS